MWSSKEKKIYIAIFAVLSAFMGFVANIFGIFGVNLSDVVDKITINVTNIDICYVSINAILLAIFNLRYITFFSNKTSAIISVFCQICGVSSSAMTVGYALGSGYGHNRSSIFIVCVVTLLWTAFALVYNVRHIRSLRTDSTRSNSNL